MSIKILATGDLHLGKKSSGPFFNQTDSLSTSYTWERIINLAVNDAYDMLILSGDVIEKDNKYFEALHPLKKGLERLDKAGVHTFIIAGNHDYDVLPQMLSQSPFKHIYFLGQNQKWESKTVTIRSQLVQLVGWSFGDQYYQQDPLIHFPSDLKQGITTIAVVHGEFDKPHSPYAPLNRNNFVRKNVNAWILGHIHKPETMEQDPLILYPGSPHALSSKEQGIHGPFVLTVNDDSVNAIQVPLSPLRFEKVYIDITDINEYTDVRNLIQQQITKHYQKQIKESNQLEYLVYDLILTGYHNNPQELLQHLSDVTDYTATEDGTQIIINRLESNIKAKVEDLERLARQTTPAGILAQIILAIENQQDNDLLDRIVNEWITHQNTINNSSTFQPLNFSESDKADQKPMAKEYLLQESHRLLAELLMQKSET